MTFLPVVARELKVGPSHRGFHWVRAALAGFGAVACVQWFTGSTAGVSLAALGQESFRSLVRLGFVLALGAMILTADSVSRERREGTLGLLFLTTLKGRDIVLGKLAASGMTAFYALLGLTPVLMLPLYVGGVTGGEVERTALSLLNLAFVALATGMFISVCARTQYAAMLGAAALLGILCFAPYFMSWVSSGALVRFEELSPSANYDFASDVSYSASPARFWRSLAFAHLEGWLLLQAATFGLARNWRSVFLPRSAKSPPAGAPQLIASPTVVVGRENRRRVFAPVARAVLRMRGLRELAWLGATIALLGSLWTAFAVQRLGSLWAASGGSTICGFLCSGLFAFAAGRFIFETRRNGELELLLVTPVGARGILREQQLALSRLLSPPFCLATLGAIPAAASAMSLGNPNLVNLLPGFCLVANTALGLLAVGLVGMWFGARVNGPFALVGWTVGLVEVVPFVMAALLPLLIQGLCPSLVALWPTAVPVLFVFKNLFFIQWARARLRLEFRTNDLPFRFLP